MVRCGSQPPGHGATSAFDTCALPRPARCRRHLGRCCASGPERSVRPTRRRATRHGCTHMGRALAKRRWAQATAEAVRDAGRVDQARPGPDRPHRRRRSALHIDRSLRRRAGYSTEGVALGRARRLCAPHAGARALPPRREKNGRTRRPDHSRYVTPIWKRAAQRRRGARPGGGGAKLSAEQLDDPGGLLY